MTNRSRCSCPKHVSMKPTEMQHQNKHLTCLFIRIQITGLNNDEVLEKKAGMAMDIAEKEAPLFRKIHAAKDAYGSQAKRKPNTIRTHMRVTSFSAFWVEAESCCWAAAQELVQQLMSEIQSFNVSNYKRTMNDFIQMLN